MPMPRATPGGQVVPESRLEHGPVPQPPALAFGNAFAPLVTARDLRWTRGAPRHFRSSNRVRRGFCGDCGTPLTYEPDGFDIELAFCTLDAPETVAPAIQIGLDARLSWCVGAASCLPVRGAKALPPTSFWRASSRSSTPTATRPSPAIDPRAPLGRTARRFGLPSPVSGLAFSRDRWIRNSIADGISRW
jgi:hypothetical protein